MSIVQRIKDKVAAINHSLAQNQTLGKAVRFQHQHLPLPVPLFDMLFRTKVGSKLLYSYGRHVYHAGYESRKDNDDFWASREAIYHHLYVQRHVLWSIIELLKQEPEIMSFLSRGDLDFFEAGFGLGRTSDESWKVEDRDEEPAIGARRRAKQETHRAVESLWDLCRTAQWCDAADAGRSRHNHLSRDARAFPKCITSIATRLSRHDGGRLIAVAQVLCC